MMIPPAGTIAIVVFFLAFGLIPVIPIGARYGVVLVAALGIYFGMDAAMFSLPNGDNLPISDLFGGSGGMGDFNKLAMGFVCGILGLLSATVGLILQTVFGKKE